MKLKLFLVTIFLLHSATPSFAQWSKIVLRTDSPVTEKIADCFFLNPDTGFVTTAAGVVYKTVDGGYNWTYDTINKDGQCSRIFFANNEVGYLSVVDGDYPLGTILKTANGGATWADVGQGMQLGLQQGIFFTSPDTGIIVGGYSNYYSTVNGGQSWVSAIIAGGIISDVCFLNDTLGFMFQTCSAFGASIDISYDAGKSWIRDCATHQGVFAAWSYAVMINDSELVGFSHQYDVIKTKISDPSGTARIVWNHNSVNPSFQVGTGDLVRNISFYNSQIGMIAFRNAVIKTEDAGESWVITDFKDSIESQTSCSFIDLMYITHITANKWITFGWCGRVYITENRGGVWQDVKEIADQPTFALSPNPATTTLAITQATTTATTAGAIAQIFTIEGKAATQKIPLVNTNTVIDVAMLPKGLYFVALQSKAGYALKKFVKE